MYCSFNIAMQRIANTIQKGVMFSSPRPSTPLPHLGLFKKLQETTKNPIWILFEHHDPGG